ncbi:MAG: RloB domain-containing protein [Phascolarctobacterium sp.]|nr:RloB domain-containing protein [Phascolarctobacterium sp.]
MGLNTKGYVKKARNTGVRIRRPIIFLGTEGNNRTETLYFRDFCQDYNRMVRFSTGNNTDPVNMINDLKSYMDKNGFDAKLGDKSYCLVDSDVAQAKNAQIAQADALALCYGIDLVLSVPCFEIWYLCYFSFSTRSYSSNFDVIKELAKYIPGYNKGLQKIYEKTKCNLHQAIINAVRLEAYCSRNRYIKHTTNFMPSTEVYKIANEIIK